MNGPEDTGGLGSMPENHENLDQMLALQNLERRAGAAGQGEAQPVAGEQQPGPIEGEPQSEEESIQQWADVYHSIASIVSMRFPSLAQVYTKERCEAVQKALHPIFERWGWNDRGTMGTVMQYLMAGVVLHSLAMDTKAAVEVDLERERFEKAKPVSSAPGDSGQAGGDGTKDQ